MSQLAEITVAYLNDLEQLLRLSVLWFDGEEFLTALLGALVVA